jgi:hypothetical protein
MVELVVGNPENRELVEAWVQAVFPLILDVETKERTGANHFFHYRSSFHGNFILYQFGSRYFFPVGIPKWWEII